MGSQKMVQRTCFYIIILMKDGAQPLHCEHDSIVNMIAL
jgi:hypothetical protein